MLRLVTLASIIRALVAGATTPMERRNERNTLTIDGRSALVLEISFDVMPDPLAVLELEAALAFDCGGSVRSRRTPWHGIRFEITRPKGFILSSTPGAISSICRELATDVVRAPIKMCVGRIRPAANR